MPGKGQSSAVCRNGHDMLANRKTTKNGQTFCAVCRRKRDREYILEKKSKNPEKFKNSWRKKRLFRDYGITLEKYNEMLSRQDGKCKICGERQVDKNLAVDHDHLTGRVRGLLCRNCNVALGLIKDSKTVAIKLLEYIVENEEEIKR